MKLETRWAFPGLVAATLVCAVALDLLPFDFPPLTFVFVLLAWIITLCLHEFSHAFTAWRFGDYTIARSGYLTLDPRTYFTPASVLLPVLVLVMGGIALPGGAVMIRTDLIRKPWQRSLIAAAGPAATLVCAIVAYGLAVLLYDVVSSPLYDALMLLAFFELMAFILNMLPVPGLDGFAIVEPWLPRKWRIVIPPKYKAVIMLGLMALVYFQGARIIFPAMFAITDLLGIDLSPALSGYGSFHFW